MRAAVVVDYQNIHLTARDRFAPHGTPAEQCLVHPLLFAEEVARARKSKQEAQVAQGKNVDVQDVEIASVQVFRGQPSNQKNPRLYRFSQAQRSEWTRDRRVKVDYRTLRYFTDHGREVAQEKGIDVRVALAVIRSVASGDYDIVILATHDTDLEPAIESAGEWGTAAVETAGWAGCRVLSRGRGFRHTALDAAQFVQTRDRRVYGP